MNQPTPPQIRDAIVRLKCEGRTYAEISALLSIGEATVSRVLRRYRETGGVEPGTPGGGNESPLRGRPEKVLTRLLKKTPDATVAELTQALVGAVAVQTSRSSVSRALARLGFTRKKRVSLRPSATRPRTGSDEGSSAC